MNKLRIAINGFGRIGRVFFRQAFENPNLEIVCIQSRSDISMYAHLLKYDSAFGVWSKEVGVDSDGFVIDGRRIPFIQSTEPEGDIWQKYDIDFVVEASGKLKSIDEASKHLDAGARHVVLTSPGSHVDGTFVFGINHEQFELGKHKVISAASCTTTCTALVVKVLEESFGVESGFINTVHAFTQDQNLHDGSHKDLRRARSAMQSIIPTSTGVTKALGELFPDLKGKFSGISFRVPVIVPSLISASFILKSNLTKEILNDAFIKANESNLKNSLGVTNLPLVSVDLKGTTTGATIDLLSTEIVDGKMANIVAWYDNEWGYVANVIRLLESIVKQ